jgi:hypothetical protein
MFEKKIDGICTGEKRIYLMERKCFLYEDHCTVNKEPGQSEIRGQGRHRKPF